MYGTHYMNIYTNFSSSHILFSIKMMTFVAWNITITVSSPCYNRSDCHLLGKGFWNAFIL